MAYMQTNVNRIRRQHNVFWAREDMAAALMQTNYTTQHTRTFSTDRRPAQH